MLISFRSVTMLQMVEKQVAASFGALVIAASRYADGGFPLAMLAAGRAQWLTLIRK
jgi:hypothetical protein